MTRLLIIGPPGAGKGTQAALLSQALQVPAISTGDTFRQQVRLGTPLGREVDATLHAGNYVSDELTNRLVSTRLADDDAAAGFILDGYPRTSEQVEELNRLLDSGGTRLDAVVHLDAAVDHIISRLLTRAQEQGRSDDTAETIRQRIDVYTRLTAPLIDTYRDKGLLITVNGVGSTDDIAQSILHQLRGILGRRRDLKFRGN